MLLKREIGLIGAAVLVVNGLIGAGIFALPAKMMAVLGDLSPYVFLVFGAMILSVVWCFASLSAHYEQTGGPVLYTEKAFGSLVSFQTGWLFYLARATAIAANAHVLYLYAGFMLPDRIIAVDKSVMVVLVCVLLTVVNLVGIKRAMQWLDSFTIIKLLPIVLIVAFGLTQADFSQMQLPQVVVSDVGAAALLTLYAFIGFETVVVTSGETKQPKRNLPLALMGTVIATAVLYFLVQLAYVSVMTEADSESAPLIAFAQVLLGQWGAILIAVAAVFSIAANLLANMISTSRLSFAMAQKAALPKWFAHVNSKFATPDYSIIALGALACLLSLTGGFVWLAVVSVLSRLCVYLACIFALLKLRHEHNWQKPAKNIYKLFWVAVPYLAILVCVGAASQSSVNAWLMLLGQILAGFILFLFVNKTRLT